MMVSYRSSSSSSSSCLTVLLLLGFSPFVMGVIPSAQLDIYTNANVNFPTKTLFASQASYGPISPMASRTFVEVPRNDERLSLVLWNDNNNNGNNNPLGCNNVTSSSPRFASNALVMIPRGECTFERKTWNAQQFGAAGVIIYDTLASRYHVNTTTSKVIYPVEFQDYDCQKGQAMVPTADLKFSNNNEYNWQHNDPLLSGDNQDNLCLLYSEDHLKECPSKRCLMTNLTASEKTKVCCAWDMHIWLFDDYDMKALTPQITIPSVFVTMEQADELKAFISSSSSKKQVKVVVKSRWQPSYNFSSIIIWMLGVFVATLAAYGSASDYHRAMRFIQQKRTQMALAASAALAAAGGADGSGASNNKNAANNNASNANAPIRIPRSNSLQEEALELEPIHALGFVLMASTSLFVLFYFKIYNVVKVFYAIGCSNAVVQIMIQPVVYKCMRRMKVTQRLLWRSSDFGDITNWDIVAGLIGYAWGMTWLYMALFTPHPATYAFFWISQDILGACMCMTFLGLIQLNSIQVATILLIVAFLYDIFFVFVTPYIFEKSIMITVATSGGPPKADIQWCEKYPHDADCQGGDPLPMLLAVPRFMDYEGGSSLLGLGDIVLPGLLLSFAARLDGAKSLVAMVSGGRSSNNNSNANNNSSSNQCPESAGGCCSYAGYYFGPLVVAYAVGLLMANTAVYVFNMGQPALLYLVPCTLGTMSFLGWRRQELKSLWDGPKVIATADEIVYGKQRNNNSAPPSGSTTSSEQQQQPNDEEAPTTTAILDDYAGGDNDDDEEAGDVPLLATTHNNKSDES